MMTITLETSFMATPLTEHNGSEHYMSDLSGQLLLETDDNESDVIGRWRGTVIRVREAVAMGRDLADLFDEVDQVTYDLHHGISAGEGERLKASINGPGDGDVLWLKALEILPPYRGWGLGLIAMRRLVEVVGKMSDVVVIEPHPIRYDLDAESAPEPWALQMNLPGSDDARPGAKRLRRHWSRLGFAPVSGTKHKYYFINPADHEFPAIEEHSEHYLEAVVCKLFAEESRLHGPHPLVEALAAKRLAKGWPVAARERDLRKEAIELAIKNQEWPLVQRLATELEARSTPAKN